MRVYRESDRGPVVAEIRAKLARLGLLVDSSGEEFDAAVSHAVRAFQQERGLGVDGLVGPETYGALDEAHWRFGDRLLSHVVARPMVGDDVSTLQHRLLDLGFDPGRCDGIFGGHTDAALRDFQRNVGTSADGTLGPSTMRALERLARTVTGGSPSQHREEERLRSSGMALAGRVVVLDPGHGGDDPGGCANGRREADLVFDLARLVEGRLGALGVRTYLTRHESSCPTDGERARFANQCAADLLVSFHLDHSLSAVACGSATYFYGAVMADRTVGSAVGKRLADLLQREVVARTDLTDDRSHGKSWELLRLTRMPAVRLDAGYLSHSGDAARLASGEFRETLAEAVVAALQRLYLPDHLDVPTGQFRLPVTAA